MINVVTNKESFINGTFGKEKFNVPYTEPVYEAMKDLQLEAENADSVAAYNAVLVSFKALVEDTKAGDSEPGDVGIEGVRKDGRSGKMHLYFGKGKISKLHFPQPLEDLMVMNREADISNESIVDLVRAFMFNPLPTQDRLDMLGNYVTAKYVDKEAIKALEEEGYNYEVAKERSTYFDLQITKHGFLKTSKVADEITEKWSIVMDADGKPVLNKEGKPKKELIPAYDTAWTINGETGECVAEVKEPEFLEDRKFKPAIWHDGDDFYSGDILGYKYEVGKLASLRDWDKVDMRDGQKHVRGLHVGSLSYVEAYRSRATQLLDCFVCPSKIGKFTDEGLGEMTVLETYISDCASIEGTTRGLYHTSKYQEIRRASFDEILKERAEGAAEVKQDIDDNFSMLKGAFSTLVADGEQS